MARIKNMKNAKKVENPGVLLKRLMGYIMKHYGAAFVTVLICILISVICNVQGTMFMQTLIDDYIVPMLKDGSRDFSGLAHAITRVAGFYAIGVAVTLLYSQIMVNITQGTLRSLRDDLFTHMQDLPIKYFDTHAHGDIMSVYTNDIDTLRQMISQSIPQIFNSGIMVVSIIVCMLVLSVPLTVVSLAMVGIMVYLSKRIATLSGKYFVQQQKDLGAANGYIEEMMQGQKVVKVFCHEEKAIEEFKEGLIDVIVTAPINKRTIQSEGFSFPGHTEYIEERFGNGSKSLMILMKDDFRVALVTGHIPVKEIAGSITKELIQEKLKIFNRSLKQDFAISAPRIAVLSLNPHAGDGGLLGTEEQEIIIPAINEMAAKGMLCYGPYPADGFMGSDNFTHFDGILAMYHDQGLAPFKALAMDEGVNFTAGLPIVRTSPAHGTAYDIAGQGIASEDSFRQAIYVALDVFRNRCIEREISAHPLRKQYYEKRDDSDKLKLDTIEEE